MRRTDFVSDLVQEIERYFDEHGIRYTRSEPTSPVALLERYLSLRENDASMFVKCDRRGARRLGASAGGLQRSQRLAAAPGAWNGQGGASENLPRRPAGVEGVGLGAVAGRHGARVAELDHQLARPRRGARTLRTRSCPSPPRPTPSTRATCGCPPTPRAAHSPRGSSQTPRSPARRPWTPPPATPLSGLDPGRCRSHDPRCLPTRCVSFVSVVCGAPERGLLRQHCDESHHQGGQASDQVCTRTPNRRRRQHRTARFKDTQVSGEMSHDAAADTSQAPLPGRARHTHSGERGG